MHDVLMFAHIWLHEIKWCWSSTPVHVQYRFRKCTKYVCIPAAIGSTIIALNAKSDVDDHIWYASVLNYVASVVIIVADYCPVWQKLMLPANQDFYTQMWHKEVGSSKTVSFSQSRRTRRPIELRAQARPNIDRVGFETSLCCRFVSESHAHHSNHVPSNCASTTMCTSINACCTPVCVNLTAWH